MSAAGGNADLEANKASARSLLGAMDTGDLDALEAMLHDDASWTILSRGAFDRDQFLALAEHRLPAGEERRSSVIGIVAEDDRVAVEYETASGDPVGYTCSHLLLTFRDGRVAAAREYLDPPPTMVFPESQAAPAGERPLESLPVTEDRTAETREVAGRFLGQTEERLSVDLVVPDVRWWVGGAGYRDFASFFANPSKSFSTAFEPPLFARAPGMIVGATVEGDRAALQLANDISWVDHDYQNDYLVVVVVRDAKVVEFREHTDRHVAARLGLHPPEAD
jgi:ketosteroid isomerase-like protein